MKPLSQALLTLTWIIAIFYSISRPGPPPPNFEPQGLGPTRAAYNPVLADSLDQGLRDFWQKPDQVLDMLGDLRGKTVADIGSGEGYFTLRLLDRVGPTGTVYANDIKQTMLDRLEARIPGAYRDRVELALADSQDTGIDEKVDVILVIQVFGEVPDQKGFLQRLKPIMHPETRLVIIDSKHFTDPANGFTRPLNLQRLIREIQTEGFSFAPEYRPENFDFLPKQFYFLLTYDGASAAAQ